MLPPHLPHHPGVTAARRRQPDNARDEARLAAAALRAGRAGADATFDRLLPPTLRDVSEDYWTPVPVVRRVASWLRAEGIGTVVDIGSGAGKFCVATALVAPCRVLGLEHRPALVSAARALAARFEVQDRVTFVEGAFGVAPTPAGDAYYLFNPFSDYSFGTSGSQGDDITFNNATYRRDVEAMTRFLAGLPAGTVVITYNGFGRHPPRSYEQVRVDVSFRGALRLWKKRTTERRVR